MSAVYAAVSIKKPVPAGCTLRKHMWDLQSQFALPVEVVGSILATYRCLPSESHISFTLTQLRTLSVLEL